MAKVGKSMMKKIPFREVLGIMHSGVSHVNMYKKHDLEKLAREKEMKRVSERSAESAPIAIQAPPGSSSSVCIRIQAPPQRQPSTPAHQRVYSRRYLPPAAQSDPA